MKKKTDAGELVDRAHWKRLTKEEKEEVIERLQAFVIDIHDEKYHPSEKQKMRCTLTQEEFELNLLLHALGYVGAFEGIEPGYVELVEKFIVYPPLPLISVAALDVLCNDWDLTEAYLDKIKSLMRGESWDYDGEVKVKAMCVAGEYIRKTSDKECLKILLEIFDNKNKSEEVRHCQLAYWCIARGFGFDDSQIDDDINPDHYIEDPVVSEIINNARMKTVVNK
jgi:hypothetical protein